jgi:DNA-directed RNA polymerase sigma subunit (sigma70/sigma32)
MSKDLETSLRNLLNAIFPEGRWHGRTDRIHIRIDEHVALVTLNMLATLDVRLAGCVCAKYGITGKPMNLREISGVVERVQEPETHIGPARARQIVQKGLRKMRHPIRAERIIRAMENAPA